MCSAEPRNSVSNNWIKDVSDDWFESWWDRWTKNSFELLEIALYFLLDCQSADRTRCYRTDPSPALAAQRRTRTGRALQRDSPVVAAWFGKAAEGRTHPWDAEFLIQGYPSWTLQQHRIHLRSWSQFILISFCDAFPGMKTGRHRKRRHSNDHCLHFRLLLLFNHNLISCFYLREVSLSVSHLFFYFLANKPSFITSQKLKYF